MKKFLFFAIFLMIFAGCDDNKTKNKKIAKPAIQPQEELVLPDINQTKKEPLIDDKCQNKDIINEINSTKTSLPYKNEIIIYRDVTCQNSTITHHYEFDLPGEALENIDEIEERLRLNLVLKSNELLELYCTDPALELYRGNKISIEWHYSIPNINDDLASIVITAEDCK